jgi:serine/threonine-protein kinase
MSGHTSAGAEARSIVDVTTTERIANESTTILGPVLAPRHVIDRYELLCPIGDGGMAHVWAARQRGAHGFEKLVALKIIHSRFADDPAFRRMFLDEARIVSPIQHRNVAQVLDLGESSSLLYLVVEYVDGESLFGLIAPERTVPVPIALRIAADTCAGLHAAHTLVDASGRSRNVVHRDVSPQNVLLGVNGEVKLIDFGLAIARDRASPTTDIGMVKGKVRYMAPEQARREPLGPFTDVFGVGAVLFRMIAGRAPYAAVNDTETLQALLALSPPLQALPPHIAPAVANVIHRAIAPKIDSRFGSARELGNAIEELLAREPRAPDVAAWVNAHLPEKALERRRLVGQWSGEAGLATASPGVPPRAVPHGATQDGAKEPSFMDVGALVARAGGGAVAPRPAQEAPPPHDEAAPVEPMLRAPSAPTEGSPLPRRKVAGTPDGSGRALKLAIVTIVVVLVATLVLVLLPMIVRERIIASARGAGLEVTIDRVGVGFDGITLRDVTAKATRVPGITATIHEVHIAGFSSKDVRVLGLDARLRGERSDLDVGIAALVADCRARFAGTPTAPHHLSVVNARLVWDGPQGERLSATDIGLELDSRGAATVDFRGSVGRFELQSQSATLGPWSSSFEKTAGASRLRLMFDPPIPDGPSALVVWPKAGPTEVRIEIRRSSFKNLGIKPSEIGIPADDATDIQLSVAGTLSESVRSELTFDASLWGLRPKGFSRAVDVHAEGHAKSTAGKPFDLEKTTITVGPFVAGISGTITPHSHGLRLDAMFKTLPLPCERLAREEAKNLGPVASTLQALGQTTGALRVTGVVNASGIVKYDTAEPQEASLTWLAKEACGVSIFGM